MVSVVIPAHNESNVVGRLLAGILANAGPGELDIVVVANGCSDDTAAVAAGYGPAVRVLQTPLPSKMAALRLGAEHARGFPRLYVDADVELTVDDVRALAAALQQPGMLAVGPKRRLVLDGRPLPVRWYYDIWQRLPAVRTGLFGRGAVAVNEAGERRLADLPTTLNDDLAASIAFTEDERRVVDDALVVIHPPRTVADLVRRRVRAVTGTVQLERSTEGVGGTRTRRTHLLGIVRAEPAMAPRLAVFLAITALVRLHARRMVRAGDFDTWLRDESSRRPANAARPGAQPTEREVG